jgi:hypothetical protein
MPRALAIGLFVLGYLLALVPFALLIQWVTRWVAGFKPGFVEALAALFFGSILTAGAEGILLFSAGVGASPHPSSGLIVALCVVPFLTQGVVCGVLLKDSCGGSLGFGRALVVNLIHSVIVGLVVMMWVLPALWDKAKAQQARASAAAAGSGGPLRSPLSSVPKATPLPMFPARRFATVAEAQREAVRLHPSLGIEGSAFNRDFVARYRQYLRERPGYFSDTSWPLRLSEETARAGLK